MNFRIGEKLPSHVRKFLPLHMWIKILSKSMNTFLAEQKFDKANTYLRTLLGQKLFLQENRGQLFSQWANMVKKSNVNACVQILQVALCNEQLSEVDNYILLEDVKNIIKLGNSISNENLIVVNQILEKFQHNFPMENWKFASVAQKR